MLARNRTSARREASRELRLELGEHVQLGVERLAVVEVPAVHAAPEERLAAGDVLDVVGDRRRGARAARLGRGEVVADRADHAHLVEERRGEREVHGGAAEHALALPERGPDRVIGDGSDDGDRHAAAEASGRAAHRCRRGRARPAGSNSGSARHLAADPLAEHVDLDRGRRSRPRPAGRRRRSSARPCSRSRRWSRGRAIAPADPHRLVAERHRARVVEHQAAQPPLRRPRRAAPRAPMNSLSSRTQKPSPAS